MQLAEDYIALSQLDTFLLVIAPNGIVRETNALVNTLLYAIREEYFGKKDSWLEEYWRKSLEFVVIVGKVVDYFTSLSTTIEPP